MPNHKFARLQVQNLSKETIRALSKWIGENTPHGVSPIIKDGKVTTLNVVAGHDNTTKQGETTLKDDLEKAFFALGVFPFYVGYKRSGHQIMATSASLMTAQDFEEYCKLAGIQETDIPAVRRDLHHRLRDIAKRLENGTNAWKGHSYSFKALDPSMIKWEASDGSVFSTSSLLGMVIHALGRDVDIIENTGYEDWIIPVPKDQENFEIQHY